MSILELLEKVGAENVVVQNLHESMHSAKTVGGDGLFTFWTDSGKVLDTTTDNPKHVGLILWIPRDLIPVEPEKKEGRTDG